MRIGYARVSKADDQDTRLQTRALKQAGVSKVFEEKASGGRWERPELHRMLEQLRKGDIVVVWKLDRLSRSLRDSDPHHGQDSRRLAPAFVASPSPSTPRAPQAAWSCRSSAASPSSSGRWSASALAPGSTPPARAAVLVVAARS